MAAPADGTILGSQDAPCEYLLKAGRPGGMVHVTISLHEFSLFLHPVPPSLLPCEGVCIDANGQGEESVPDRGAREKITCHTEETQSPQQPSRTPPHPRPRLGAST